MIASLFFAALILGGHSKPADPVPETDEVVDYEDSDSMTDDEIINEEFPELRAGNPTQCAEKPSLTNVYVFSGPCRAEDPYTPERLRKGGKMKSASSFMPLKLIKIPPGATECTLMLITDNPGTMHYLASNKTGMLPFDAELSAQDDVTGTVVFKKRGKRIIGWSRATTTFKYSAPSATTGGRKTMVLVFSSCIQGCHEHVKLEQSAPTAEISISAAPGGIPGKGPQQIRNLCEYWIATDSTRHVDLVIPKFKAGRNEAACSKGKVVIDKGGNKFFSSDPETFCGKVDAFNVSSNNANINVLVRRIKKTTFSATASMGAPIA